MRLIDLTGQTFGRLTVIERAPTRKRVTYWRCRCECGRAVDVSADNLRRKTARMCTCVPDELAAGRRPWPADTQYLVGADGSIVGPSGRVLQPRPNTHGYLAVSVRADDGWKTKTVHSIVCEAFHGPRPEGMEVAHGNGVRTDNRAANLRWATSAENAADRGLHGTAWRGVKHHRAKLTEDQVRAIRAASAAGASQRALAAQYGVSRRAVTFILSRRNWAHVA